MVLCLPLWAGAQTPAAYRLDWTREAVDGLEYIVLGTAHVAEGGIHGVTIVASTKYVTSPLQIPNGTLYADITIRSGSESATILSASAVSGTIDSASFVRGATLAFFTRKYDADLFISDIQDDAYSGTPSLYAGAVISNVSQISGMDGSEYEYYVVNTGSSSASNLFKSYGTYRIPVNAGYLVLKFDSPPSVKSLNRIGQFISVRFTRVR